MAVEATAWHSFICNDDIGFWLAIDIDLYYWAFSNKVVVKMSMFKMGEKAWWFIDIDGHIIKPSELELDYYTICTEKQTKYEWDYAYHSRREALEALSKRLKELLDND